MCECVKQSCVRRYDHDSLYESCDESCDRREELDEWKTLTKEKGKCRRKKLEHSMRKVSE